MKKNLILIFLISISLNYSQNRREFFKSPTGLFLIASDLHIHSVFSDGRVWPSIRVEEARRDSLDLISLTEHIEYLSYRGDLNYDDRNRAFQIASGIIQDNETLMVINGSEITKPMPPGHFNAVFLRDANKLNLYNKLNIEDGYNAIKEANNQGAFVFWNHPNWIQNRDDGIARLDSIHNVLLDENLLHGIEVVNEQTYSEEALEIAISNNLTIMGTSDVHGLIDWDYPKENNMHRPITFIISKNRTKKSIRDALFDRRTFVWHRDMLVGKEENIEPIIQENFQIKSMGYYKKILTLRLINKSVVPFQLKYQGNYTFHHRGPVFEVPAKGYLDVTIKTLEILDKIRMDFEIQNIIIAPKKFLEISKTLEL